MRQLGEQLRATATHLAESLCGTYHDAEDAQPERLLKEPILVDNNGNRNFLAAIRDAFRGLRSKRHPGISMVKTPRFRDSRPDEVMQLADMVCGAAGASLQGKLQWYELIKGRCVRLTLLP